MSFSIREALLFVSSRKLDRPVFIWGAPRSGTTLLYNFVSKHPAVGYFGAENKTPAEGTGIWWRAFGEHRGEMGAALAARARVRKIRFEYYTLLTAQRKTRLLDKIPFMTLWIPLVDKVFPDARHVHIIRDGRAVVNSILWKLRYSDREKDGQFREERVLYGPQPAELVNPMGLPSALRHARQWVLLVEQGQRNREKLGERYFEVRYEDLVASPRLVMQRVLKHCQLNPVPAFIKRVIPERLENRNGVWILGRESAVPTGFGTRRAFEPGEMDQLREMNPLLKRLGYPKQIDVQTSQSHF